MNFLRKYHKWIGLIAGVFFVLYSISGIILNHRELLATVDISRNLMPSNYEFKNWNLSGVKTTEKISNDSILIYGNVGIWLTDSSFSFFRELNEGIPSGIDNRKTCVVRYLKDRHQLFAGTLFGFYRFDFDKGMWHKVSLPVHEKRVVDLTYKDDTLFVLTRSHLLFSTDMESFKVKNIPPPEGYDNKIGLFKTLWVIHSGEIYGNAGKIIVDIIALIFIFLTITGILVFFKKRRLQRNNLNKTRLQKLKNSFVWNLKWHNKIGWMTAVLLLITASTGIFLRPPFLIPIANAKVSKIPFTELDTDNPWFDNLRKIYYDKQTGNFIIFTPDNVYFSKDNFKSPLKEFYYKPPFSVMGITYFERYDSASFLVGSFEGLYLWNPSNGFVYDYIDKKPYVPPKSKSRPIGKYLVAGFTKDFSGGETVFEYNNGAFTISGNKSFPELPENVKKAYRASLWFYALEVHTGRIFQFILGDFYILIVPLVGLSAIYIIISGVWIWFFLYRKRPLQNKKRVRN